MLGSRAGLRFRLSQRETVERAIALAMKAAQVSDLRVYLRVLETDPIALDALLALTTVGETYFFRNPEQYETIARQILPSICNQRRDDHPLRVWSAGCSTGEEAYSLAMLLHRQGLLSRSFVLGTDICREALRTAREATYRDWSLRGPGRELAQPYLTPQGERYQVGEAIRQAVAFRYLNLASDNYPSFASGACNLDLILCRNVMIYFDRDTIRAIVNRLHDCLAEGGWLLTSASDPPLHEYGLFEVVATDHGSCFRKPLRSAAIARPRSVRPAVPRQRADTSSAVRRTPADTSPPGPDSRIPLTKRESEPNRRKEPVQSMGAGETPKAEAEALDAGPELLERIKALANQNPQQAINACAQAAAQHPLSLELHYLHAILLLGKQRLAEAAAALRRVLYLDRNQPLAQFSLGVACRAAGNLQAACRAFRSAITLCAALPGETPLPLDPTERAGDVLRTAQTQLAEIERFVRLP